MEAPCSFLQGTSIRDFLREHQVSFSYNFLPFKHLQSEREPCPQTEDPDLVFDGVQRRLDKQLDGQRDCEVLRKLESVSSELYWSRIALLDGLPGYKSALSVIDKLLPIEVDQHRDDIG